MDRRHWGLAALMGGVHFLFHVFIRLIPPLIPILTISLGYPLWKLGLLVSGYFVGSSIGLLPMGVLSDRFDRRATLSGALVVVGTGYVVFSFAPEIGTALPTLELGGYLLDGPFAVMSLAMLISGFGTSAHVPVGVPIITTNASEANRGRILGVWGGGSKLGDAAGPAIIGVLILALGWRPILLAFGLAGIGTAVVLYLVLGLSGFETRPAVDRSVGEADASTFSPFRGERRRYLYPMLVLMGYFAAFNVAVQGTVTFVPTFITEIYGYSFRAAGIAFGPESFADFALSVLLISGALSRFAGGILVDRYEHRKVLAGSLGVAAIALLVFSVSSLEPLILIVVLVIFGSTLWGNSPARDSLISDLTPAEHEGRTFSYLWTASRVFGAGSPALIGFLAGTVGIRRGFTYLAISTMVAAGFVLLLFSGRVYDPSPVARTAPTDD